MRNDTSGIKIKAAVWTKARTVRFRIMKQKDVVNGVFQVDGKTYFTHPDRSLLTHAYTAGKLWLFRTYYQTYYYVEDKPQPIPPLLDGSLEPDGSQAFPKAVNLGLTSEELSGTFNPYFLRIISQVGPQWWEQVNLLVGLATVLGVLYLAYIGSTHPTAEEIAAAFRAAQAGQGAVQGV